MPVKQSSQYDPVERRIRAAMMLAGLDFKGLADRIDAANLRESTLRRLNAHEPRATKIHLRAIAEACSLPYEFFTVDFKRLPELEQAPPVNDGLIGELRELRERVDGLQFDLSILAAEAHPQGDAGAASKPRQVRRKRPQ